MRCAHPFRASGKFVLLHHQAGRRCGALILADLVAPGLLGGVQGLVGALDSGFDAVVEVRETVEGAARSVRLTLVRLLRECSTNMLRYAPSGSRCTLRAWVHDFGPRPPVRRPVLVSIEPAGMAETRCIAVSHPSRLYLTSDYCVTHNTAFSLNIGEHVAVEAVVGHVQPAAGHRLSRERGQRVGRCQDLLNDLLA